MLHRIKKSAGWKRDILGIIVLAAASVAWGGNSHISTNLTEVLTATFIGGEGTEWFTSGAFPGDESIIVAGVTLNPELVLRGVQAKPYGADAPALPPMTEFRRLAAQDTGILATPPLEITKIDQISDAFERDTRGFSLAEPPTAAELAARAREKAEQLRSVPRGLQFFVPKTVEEKIAYARLTGLERQATGFIGRFSADLKRVLALYRLPRGAGSITGVSVSKGGDVYITGIARDRIVQLSENRREETIPDQPGISAAAAGPRRLFLARLAPDLSKVLWVVDLHTWTTFPRVQVLANGNISLFGPGARIYNPDGELVVAAAIAAKRVYDGSSVCPLTGRFVRVGDWMSGTGREPYRCPRLVIHNPDGSVEKFLFGWRGPFAAIDPEHLVADSAVRQSAFSKEGILVYSTWSHGGNNVCGRLPYDIERRIPEAMRYVGSQTYCYIVRLGPEHNVLTGTLWTSAGSIRTLAVADDGSIVWVGSAHPDWTPNSLARGPGQLLCVTEPSLGGFRFQSAMPACGSRVAVGGGYDATHEWAFASGTCNGRPMLLGLTGAVAEEKGLAETWSPPQKNPLQPGFGGGLMDGYALLMDMTPKTALQYELPEEPKQPPRPASPYEGPPLIWPVEGQEFRIGTERYVTVRFTFRDEQERMWPTFFQGSGEPDGAFTYGETNAAAAFTLSGPGILQDEGVQTQRVLGELLTPDGSADWKQPGAAFIVTNMSPWERTDRWVWAGVGLTFPIGTCKVSGTLRVGKREIPIRDAAVEARFAIPRRVVIDRPNGAVFSIKFRVPGASLGLRPPLDQQAIKVTILAKASSSATMTSTTPEPGPIPVLDGTESEGAEWLDEP